MSSRRLWLLVGLCLCLPLAGPASALPVEAQDVTVRVEVGGTVVALPSQTPGTSYDEATDVTDWWMVDAQGAVSEANPWGGTGVGIRFTRFDAELKEDPFVTSNVTFTNPMPFTQTYTITVSIPIPAYSYDATIASSIGVTVTDSTNGSATVSSVVGQGIYSGQVNGGTILTLMPHTTTVSCPPPVGTGCSATLADNTALPQLAATPGIATSIGIVLKFTLTPFDQVAITSRFEIIDAVPEPGTAALLAAGLAGLAIAGRRRS
jgi:hypothetical protein